MKNNNCNLQRCNTKECTRWYLCGQGEKRFAVTTFLSRNEVTNLFNYLLLISIVRNDFEKFSAFHSSIALQGTASDFLLVAPVAVLLTQFLVLDFETRNLNASTSTKINLNILCLFRSSLTQVRFPNPLDIIGADNSLSRWQIVQNKRTNKV